MVTPQALDHAKRVGRPFEQLRELLIVECQAGALCRLRTGLACCDICLIGSTRQNWWWRQGGYLSSGAELRMLLLPAGRLLIGMANAEHRHLVEGPTKYLHPERQAMSAKAIADLQ